MVQEFRDDRKIDVMFFTECWLKDDTAAIGHLENGNFKFINQFRNSRQGGRIGCLFNSKLVQLDTLCTKPLSI